MNIEYSIRQVADVTVVDLTGRISLRDMLASGQASVVVLHQLIEDQVADGHKKVLLNLRGVSYIDSSGLGDLMSATTVASNHGGQLRVCEVSPRVQDLLRITHLDTLLNIDQDEPAALQAFSVEQKRAISA